MTNMTTERKMREAMSCLHAPDNLTERVLERAAAPRRRRGGPLPLAAVVAGALAGVLATGGVAYAVVASGFFDRAFGAHGLGDQSSWDLVTDSGDAYRFTREYDTVAAGAASEDLAAAVEEVGLSVTADNGYVLTIESMVVDENGCGAVNFTLENPNGFGDAANEQNPTGLMGGLWFQAAGLNSITMGFGDAQDNIFPSCSSYYDVSSLTSTSLSGTMYFSAFGGLEDVLLGARWGLSWTEGEGDSARTREASTDAFTPTKVIEARELSDGSGGTVRVSPLGLTVSLADGAGDASSRFLSVRMTDGSEFVVYDNAHFDDPTATGTVNYYTSLGRADGSSAYVFAQLVDVTQVESVVTRGEDSACVFSPVS